MRKLLAVAALSFAAFGQESDPAMAISGGPPARAWTAEYKYTTISGTDYVEYICYARSGQTALSAAVSQIVDASNTATVTTSAAHGLSVNNRVVIAGVTGDTDMNGTYTILTVPSTTTFTVTSANVTDATYNNSGITIESTAPRTNRNIWSIKRFTYGGTGGNNLLRTQWAVRSGQATSGTGAQHSCDDRATLAYQ